MSTTNHNILYFFSVCRIRPLNMGICLWKAQNRLSGRGFGAACTKTCAKCRPASGSALNQKPSLHEGNPQEAKQVQIGRISVRTVDNSAHLFDDLEGGSGAGHLPQTRFAPTGGNDSIGRLLPVLLNEELLGGILGPIPAAVASQDDPALLTGSLRCCLAGRLRLCCPPIQVLFTGSRFGLLRPSR
jgi:hypothetical protein